MLGAWLLVSVLLHLVWEIAQLPLYTPWREASPVFIAWAVAHCTAGDGLIALGAYAVASASARSTDWPWRSPGSGLVVMWLAGLGWTAFSEWRHVYRLGSWAYAEAMPRLAGIGLAPLAQWAVVPALALWCLREWNPARGGRSAALQCKGSEDDTLEGNEDDTR